MKDVQSEQDHREIDLDRVGVRDLRYPVVVLDQQNREQATVASLTLAVDLPRAFKGTHMSRFLEVLNEYRGEMTMRTMPAILADLREKLEAKSSFIEMSFPYFIERAAPVTGAKGLLDYEGRFVGQSSEAGDDFILGVRVPVSSLCPCSKAISDYGAHNQRGTVSIDVRSPVTTAMNEGFVWLEELIDIAEASGSAPVFPLLKRPDERHVTMLAFDRPRFVEDMVREVAERLMADSRICWFDVQAVNYESIHNHNAFAQKEWSRD